MFNEVLDPEVYLKPTLGQVLVHRMSRPRANLLREALVAFQVLCTRDELYTEFSIVIYVRIL